MRRLLLVGLFLSAFGVIPASACEGAVAGEYDTATVTFERGGQSITIYAEQFGNSDGGPTGVCADGTTQSEPTRALMTITVDGIEVCHRTDALARLRVDPFGFGAAVRTVHTDGTLDGACGADVTWDGLDALFEPDPDALGAGADGARAGLAKNTLAYGYYWIDGGEPLDSYAYGSFTRGARVAITS